MILKPCPVCGQKPLLFSNHEVTCINGLCPVNGFITRIECWNNRAEVISRDKQLLREIRLEHSFKKNIERISVRFPEIHD